MFDKLAEEVDELQAAHRAGDNVAVGEELGDLLFATVNLARHLEVDAETALCAATGKFDRRFRYIEAQLRKQDRRMQDCTLAELDRIWEQVDCVGETRGCFMVNTATELRSLEPALTEVGAQHRDFLRAGFTAALERAVDLGELDRDRVTDLANVLVATALGLAVMIRGGASTTEISAHLKSAKQSLRLA